MAARAVVIGATGGIGAALAEAWAPRGTMMRLSRRSDPPVDVLDEASIAAAAAAVGGNLDLVFDATGFLHGDGLMPEKSFRHIDAAHLARSFAVNAIGPALLMKHFLPRLAADRRAVFATLSARVGSISDNRLGGWYAYRAAKAGLNQLVKTASIELARTRPLAICVALHPGTVATPLSAPFAKSSPTLMSPSDSAARLLAVLETLGTEQSGMLIDYAGLIINP